MYHVSKYVIAQPLTEGEMLVYSTLSTSIVTLENEVYRAVFEERAPERFPALCGELEEMGFIFRGDAHRQAKLLEEVRREVAGLENGLVGITIAPTMRCNARCYYCFERGAEQETMSIQTASAVAEFCISHCTGKKLLISWFGGEPLLAIDIIDYINDAIQAAGIEVESTLITNGLLLGRDVLQKLGRWNVQRVQITLDGVEAEYNRIKNYVSPAGDPFRAVAENIQNLLATGTSTHLRVNYKSDDYAAGHATLEYLHQRFGKWENLYLYGAPLDLPHKKGYSEFDAEEGEAFLKVLHLSLDNGYENDELNFRAGVNVSPDYNAVLGELMLSPFPASCLMVNKLRLAVDGAGRLYKCQKYLGKRRYACGSVHTGLVQNDIFRYHTAAKLHDPQCEECFLLPVCQGGCNANRVQFGPQHACPPSKTIAPKLVMSYYNHLVGQT